MRSVALAPLGGGGVPWHVLEIDAVHNRIVVGRREDLQMSALAAGELNWVAQPGPPVGPFRCRIQIRQRHRAAPATARVENDKLLAEFDEPQSAVTPGQIAVCYDGDWVLCSGVIVKTPPVGT